MGAICNNLYAGLNPDPEICHVKALGRGNAWEQARIAEKNSIRDGHQGVKLR